MKLIHPIYLDVPMLVSFAAAIQGGLAFETEVTEQSATEISASGKSSARFGISELFSTLFNASVSVESAATDASQDQQVRRESKSHTEASIAILLYEELRKQEGFLMVPDSSTDLQGLEPGALVELSGTVSKNAVDAVIDYMEAVTILANLSAKPAGKQQKSATQPVKQMRDALARDRERTPISNALLQCSQPAGLWAVLTLRTENLRDLTLSELHKNHVHVVGKVTRFVPDGEEMSSFENYGLGLMKPEQLAEAFEQITSNQDMLLEFSPVSVSGPAVQILPLMVFV